MDDDKLLKGPNINILSYPIEKCSKCGSPFFVGRIIMRRIPGFVAGAGVEDVMFPMKVLVCDKCGQVFEDDIKTYKLEELFDEQPKEEKSNKSTSLIL